MSEKMKQMLRDGNAAVGRGDNEGFLALCTEDTEWNFLGDQVLRGKDEVRAYMKETYKQPPETTVEKMIAEGNTLVVVGTISLNGGAAQEYCDVWEFRDGKLAKVKAFVI